MLYLPPSLPIPMRTVVSINQFIITTKGVDLEEATTVIYTHTLEM